MAILGRYQQMTSCRARRNRRAPAVPIQDGAAAFQCGRHGPGWEPSRTSGPVSVTSTWA